MISVVVPYFENYPAKREMLRRTIATFSGHDELIIVWNDGMGFSKAVNLGFQMARGDYIVMASDDAFFQSGSFRDLAIENTVTSPVVNGVLQDFSGVMWCVPRKIYEEHGLLDEGFSDGIYFEDEDYWLTLKAKNIPHRCVESVNISHPNGGATLKEVPERQEKIQRNRDYLEKKWGKINAKA